MAAGRGKNGHQLGNSPERQGVSFWFVYGLFISRPQGYWARGYTSVARYIRASLLSHILLPLSILLGFWKDGEKRTGVPKKTRCYLGAAHFFYAPFPGEDLFFTFLPLSLFFFYFFSLNTNPTKNLVFFCTVKLLVRHPRARTTLLTWVIGATLRSRFIKTTGPTPQRCGAQCVTSHQ